MNIPNLDSLPTADLLSFCEHHADGAHADELGVSRDIAESLVAYACGIISARAFRVRGCIASAIIQERIADRIFYRLPAEARW